MKALTEALSKDQVIRVINGILFCICQCVPLLLKVFTAVLKRHYVAADRARVNSEPITSCQSGQQIAQVQRCIVLSNQLTCWKPHSIHWRELRLASRSSRMKISRPSSVCKEFQ